jgi:hypothetical protein
VRFLSKIDASGDCWIWTGARNTDGYGIFGFRDPGVRNGVRHQVAHRSAWEILVGPIPDGLVIDHLCRTPACVNPDHIEPVTQRTNNLRGYSRASMNAKKTVCVRGHALTPDNLLRKAGRIRQCRECNRQNHDRRNRAEGKRRRGEGVRPCGTVAGYSRHRKACEPICDPCRLAWNARCRDAKRARRAAMRKVVQ